MQEESRAIIPPLPPPVFNAQVAGFSDTPIVAGSAVIFGTPEVDVTRDIVTVALPETPAGEEMKKRHIRLSEDSSGNARKKKTIIASPCQLSNDVDSSLILDGVKSAVPVEDHTHALMEESEMMSQFTPFYNELDEDQLSCEDYNQLGHQMEEIMTQQDQLQVQIQVSDQTMETGLQSQLPSRFQVI